MARGKKATGTKKGDEKRSAVSVFKAIDNLLRQPGSGCGDALAYMEQSSWLLFLRYLDANEAQREDEAALMGGVYEPLLPEKLRWSSWAYPLTAEGRLDINRRKTGDDLIDFVREELFPGLQELQDAYPVTSPQYGIGSVFKGMTCRFTSGASLTDVIDLIQPLSFQTEEERHELSVLYEERLRAMGNAGRDGGQYYTPRPLIRVMTRVLDPKIGETVYDGACGSGGFLCEAYNYLLEKARTSGEMAYEILQQKTFYGCEVKELPYITARMNCILHGLLSPNIEKCDTLAKKIADFTDSDRVDVILANPPFGAATNEAVLSNFIVQTKETATLFMEHFIAKLRKGGRAAIVIKNTFLSNGNTADIAIRKMLLEKCSLDWVLDLPQGVFVNAGVRAVVLFFTKGEPTTRPIHYYQMDLKGVTLGKKRVLTEDDLAEFEALATGKQTIDGCPQTWTIDPATLDTTTYDLSVRNSNIVEEKLPSSQECLTRIRETHARLAKLLEQF